MAIDFEAIFGVDDYDPCAALRALRPAYMQALTTGNVQKISFRDRETWFHPTDMKAWGSVIARLEAECSAKNGKNRQFAITIGGRRQPYNRGF